MEVSVSQNTQRGFPKLYLHVQTCLSVKGTVSDCNQIHFLSVNISSRLASSLFFLHSPGSLNGNKAVWALPKTLFQSISNIVQSCAQSLVLTLTLSHSLCLRV